MSTALKAGNYAVVTKHTMTDVSQWCHGQLVHQRVKGDSLCIRLQTSVGPQHAYEGDCVVFLSNELGFMPTPKELVEALVYRISEEVLTIKRGASDLPGWFDALVSGKTG